MLAALLESARPAGVAEGELTLAWPQSAGFLKRKAEDPANKELIGARDPRGHRAARCGSRTSCAPTASSPPRPERPELSEEELVNRFVEEFDAEVLPPEEEPT